MIKIDNNEITMEGNAKQILIELSYGVSLLARNVAKASENTEEPISVEDALANILIQIVGSTAYVLHIDKEDK